jgi:protein-S-isoprenylcysteine O-methyltransferase Ste14
MKRSFIDPMAEFMAFTGKTLRSIQFSKRWIVAVSYGFICHLLFTISVLAMLVSMFFGMSQSFGKVPHPYSYFSNLLLIIQFPLAHSFLLSSAGKKYLLYFSPKNYSFTLAPTVFVVLASTQLFLLFFFWTPTKIIIWEASGMSFYLMCSLYSCSWLLLIWATIDAGVELQSGALGWMSLAQNKAPKFPDLPTFGLFKYIRQPIYASFALTTWTTPVWTPDQFFIAVIFTSYCVIAPRLKEKRLEKQFGAKFTNYKSQVPYMVPSLSIKKKPSNQKR